MKMIASILGLLSIGAAIAILLQLTSSTAPARSVHVEAERAMSPSRLSGLAHAHMMQENTHLHERLDQLQDQIDQLESSRKHETPANPPNSQEIMEPANPSGEAMDPADVAAEMAASFDARIDREQADSGWSQSMVDHLRETIQASFPAGVELHGAICRTTMCRLDMAFSDATAKEQFMLQVSRLLEGGAEGFAHIENEEDLEIEVYFMRGGHRLPELAL